MDKRSSLIYFLMTFLAVIIIAPPPANAKVFRNSYIEFQLPDQWACYLANTAWVCRYAIPQNCAKKDANSKDCKTHKDRTREAIIILTAKETGPRDSMVEYENYLKVPKTILDRKAAHVKSKVIHLERPKIVGIPWVDGMHMGSEVPDYYTRYLATVQGRVAVLVTFSAHKRHYTKYSTQFFETIKTLKVIQPAGGLKKARNRTGLNKPPPKAGGTGIDPEIFDDIDTSGQLGEGDGDSLFARLFGGENGTTNLMLLMAFILASVGVYIWSRGRR